MRKLRILSLLVALLMATACAFAETAEGPVVIKAGTAERRLPEVQAYFDNLYDQYNEYYTSYGQALTQEEVGYILDETMFYMTAYAVMDAKVAELGLGEITEAEAAELRDAAKVEYEAVVQDYVQAYGVSDEDAQTELLSYDVTEELVYESMLESLPYERLQASVVDGVTISDADVQAQYDVGVESDKATYEGDIQGYEMAVNYYGTEVRYTPAGYRMVKHILLAPPAEIAEKLTALETQIGEVSGTLSALNEELYALENVAEATVAPEGAEPAPEATEKAPPRAAEAIEADIAATQTELDGLNAEYAAAREQVPVALKATTDEIYAKLDAGESFDALVEAYGTDPGMVGNTEGYQVHANSVLYDTVFQGAAMALAAIGDVSDPVLTDFGIHIITYASDVPEGAVEMSEATRETIRAELLATEQNMAFAEQLEIWQTELAVEAHPELVAVPTIEAEPVDVAPLEEPTAEQTVAPTEAPAQEPAATDAPNP